MKIENKYLILVILNIFVVIGIVVMNFLFLKEMPNVFSAVNILAGVMFVLPVILWQYLKYRKTKVIEEIFPTFLRDFIESMRGGLTIEQSMKSLKKNDYKELNPYVTRMAAQLDWGIPVETVLSKFAQSTKSKLIGRIVSSVVESNRFGGNLTDTFEALNNATIEVERLKAERSMYLYSQVMTGYIIFFVFLGVIIALGRFLIPSLTNVSITGVTTVGPEQQDLSSGYKSLFMNLIVIQGLFAGLSVGKMSEGALIGGIKHSLIMVIAGVVVYMFAG
jgi:pilus assembly protein TadC